MSKYVAVLMVTLAMACFGPTVAAQEELTEETPPEPNWSGSAGLSYVATTGNTETSSFGLDFKMERKPTPWGVEFTALFNTAEDDGRTTAERYQASARAKRALTERWELFAGLAAERDQFAGYDLLSIVEAGGTYRALLGPKHHLSFDAGLAWTDEDRVEGEPDVSYFGGVAGLSYEWKFSDTAALTQRLDYFPNFDESADWRLNSVTAVQASLTEILALRASYELRYRNQPIGTNEDTDTSTKVSLVASF